MRIINLELLVHPLNWLTLLVWLFAIALLVHAATGKLGKATPSVAAVA